MPWYLGRGESHFWEGCRTAFSSSPLAAEGGTGKGRSDGRATLRDPRGGEPAGPGGCGARAERPPRAQAPGPPRAAPAAGTIARAGGRAGGAAPGRRPLARPRARTPARTLAPTRRPPRHCSAGASPPPPPRPPWTSACTPRRPRWARGPGPSRPAWRPGLLPLRQGRRGGVGARRAGPARAFGPRAAPERPAGARGQRSPGGSGRGRSGTRAGTLAVWTRGHTHPPALPTGTHAARADPLGGDTQRPELLGSQAEVTRQLLTRSHSDTLTTSP